MSEFFSRVAALKWVLGGERAAKSRTDLGTELVVSSPAWKHKRLGEVSGECCHG